jgi:hypothetical protein
MSSLFARTGMSSISRASLQKPWLGSASKYSGVPLALEFRHRCPTATSSTASTSGSGDEEPRIGSPQSVHLPEGIVRSIGGARSLESRAYEKTLVAYGRRNSIDLVMNCQLLSAIGRGTSTCR